VEGDGHLRRDRFVAAFGIGLHRGGPGFPGRRHGRPGETQAGQPRPCLGGTRRLDLRGGEEVGED
jgi:hypothetical protein